MKIKDLIKHLETLDQEKQLLISGVDPTDYATTFVLKPECIEETTVWPIDSNGDVIPDLEGAVNKDFAEEGGDVFNDVDCYIIKFDC